MTEPVSNSATVRHAETRFVGRTEELAQLAEYVDAGRRLITIVGPPGAGKTRTLREFERRAIAEESVVDAIWCELASARNREEVVAVVAAAVGTSVPPGDDFAASVAHVTSAIDQRSESGRGLLLLDNFEHLTDWALETIGAWYANCPNTCLLISSRHRLDLPGEYVFDLEPLSEPDAVELFVDRARMVERDFDTDDDEILRRLVNRLDRLPLAIELAAARVSTLPPTALIERLDARFDLLRSRKRGLEPRQATLRAAIAWSWDLLDEAEQSALSQCSLFRGGFTIAAAEEVLKLDDEWVLDVVESLRAKSLLAVRSGGDGSRLALYESVRDFAAEQLAERDDTDATRRHASYFAQLGAQLAAKMHGRGGHDSMRALERESANMFAAFQRVRHFDAELALQLAASLNDLLRFVGPSELHEELLEQALQTAQEANSQRYPVARFLRARAELNAVRGNLDDAVRDLEEALGPAEGAELGLLMLRLGENLRTRGDATEGAERLTEAIEIGEQVGDARLVRTALGHLASCYVDLGLLDEARGCLTKLSDTARTNDLRGECELLKRTAYVQYYLGNYGEQRRQNEEALALAREIGDRRLEGLCLQGVGDSAFAMGEFDEAVQFYERGLEIHRALGNRHFEAMLLGNLGGAYHRGANFVQARRCYARSLELHRSTGARPYEGVVSFALGALEHESGQADDAHFHYDRALDIARDTDQPSDVGALLLCKAWVDLESATFSEESLRRRTAEALKLLADSDGSWDAVAVATTATIELLSGNREKAERLYADADDRLSADGAVERAITTALQQLRAVSQPGFADPHGAIASFGDDAIYRRSLHARLAARLLRMCWRTAVAESTGEQLSEASDQPTIEVDQNGRWFRLPGGEKVDLRRRKALRLVLTHLLDRHEEEPGRGSDVHEVFEQGWPGEEIHPDQAVERVYWAVRTLRKLGMEEILLTSDEGYHLRVDLLVNSEQ